MRKILITGNAGSGKSTLSRVFGKKMNLPVFSLDGIVWKSGWQKPSPEERRVKMEQLLSRDSWVIDGVSLDVLREAEMIIFLDLPLSVCFFRVIKRNWRYLFCSRPELPKNCPEIKIIPQLFKIMWNFPNIVRPQILNEITKYPNKKFVHVRNTRQLMRINRMLTGSNMNMRKKRYV